MSEPIYRELRAKAAHARNHVEDEWHAFTRHWSQPHYDDHQQPPSPAPAEHPMATLIKEIVDDIQAVAAKVESIDPAAADRLAALNGNPVADALLAASHIPVADLAPVVAVIQTLGELTRPADPETPADAPDGADVGQDPQPQTGVAQ